MDITEAQSKCDCLNTPELPLKFEDDRTIITYSAEFSINASRYTAIGDLYLLTCTLFRALNWCYWYSYWDMLHHTIIYFLLISALSTVVSTDIDTIT